MRTSPRLLSVPTLLTSLATFLVSATSPHAFSADILKANNVNALNTSASWVGGTIPGASDVAVYDGTIDQARSAPIGGNLSWSGIRVLNPGGTQTVSGSTGFSLTLGSSGIDMSNATANLIVGAVANFAADQTWNIAAGRTLQVSGVNSGNSTITLTGTGDITASNFSFGNTTVQINDNINFAVGNVTYANNLTLNSDFRLSPTATNAVSFTGNVNVGNGTRTITINQATANGTNNSFLLGGNSAAGTSYTGTGGLAIVSGNPGGSPALNVRIGGGGTNWSQINTGLTIGNGIVAVLSSTGAFTTQTRLEVASGGTFNLANGINAITVSSGTVASLAGAGTITTSATTGTSTLTIDGTSNTTTTTFSGNITEGGGGARVAIVKTGNTTQIFSGSNSYGGQTQVNAGTLLLNGTHIESSALSGQGYGNAGTGHFQVANGATFGGSGRISGFNSQANSNMVLVQSGGRVNPGSGGIGNFTLDGANITGAGARVLNMAAGAIFNFDIAANGLSSDRIDFWNFATGDLLLNNNTINLNLVGTPTGGDFTVSLFRFFGNNGTTLTTSGITGGLTLGTVTGDFQGTPSLVYNSAGGTIDLTFTVIPEPATSTLLIGGASLVLARRRRRSP